MFRLNTRSQAPSSLYCTGWGYDGLPLTVIRSKWGSLRYLMLLSVGTATKHSVSEQPHKPIIEYYLWPGLVLPPIDDEDGVHRTSIYPTGSLLLVGIFKMLWFCCGHSNLKNISITFQATTIIIIGPVTSHSTLHFTLNNLAILDTHDNSRASSPITTHSVTT